jgi:hypothetical protein
MENSGQDVKSFIEVVLKITEGRKEINNHILKHLGDSFNNALSYLDTKRDRDTVIALMEKITSVKFVSEKLAKGKKDQTVQN